MISWRLCLVFVVIFYSKSAMSCSYNYHCPDYEECCDGVCSSSCSDSSEGPSGVVVIIVVLCVVIGKIIFWLSCCYCWHKRRSRTIVFRRFDTGGNTVIVRQSTAQMTPTASQGYTTSAVGNNPVQKGYPSPGYDCPPGTTLNEGDIITNPANNPLPPYTEEHES